MRKLVSDYSKKFRFSEQINYNSKSNKISFHKINKFVKLKQTKKFAEYINLLTEARLAEFIVFLKVKKADRLIDKILKQIDINRDKFENILIEFLKQHNDLCCQKLLQEVIYVKFSNIVNKLDNFKLSQEKIYLASLLPGDQFSLFLTQSLQLKHNNIADFLLDHVDIEKLHESLNKLSLLKETEAIDYLVNKVTNDVKNDLITELCKFKDFKSLEIVINFSRNEFLTNFLINQTYNGNLDCLTIITKFIDEEICWEAYNRLNSHEHKQFLNQAFEANNIYEKFEQQESNNPEDYIDSSDLSESSGVNNDALFVDATGELEVTSLII